MADGNGHPFNTAVIASDTVVQLQKQTAPLPAHPAKHRDLLDLLSANNSNNPSINVFFQTITDDDFDRLKTIIRSTLWPADHSIRRQLWMNILTFNRVNASKQQAQGAISTPSITIDPNSHALSAKANQWPAFVESSNLCLYHLTEPNGRLLLQRVLFTFALHHPDLPYCPAVQPFAALLLHYFNEHEVLYLIDRLLTKHWLCGETRLQWEANSQVFRKLLRNYFKATADMIDLRYSNTKAFYQEWFWWIFRYLPFSYIVKIMDCFFFEGPKILYRVGLALVHLFIKTTKHDSNGTYRGMEDFCQQIPIPVEQLLKVAFQIRNLKRSAIEQLVNHEEKVLHSSRYHPPAEDNTQSSGAVTINASYSNNTSVSNNGALNDRHSSFVTHQHFTHIPSTSVLDHQQFVTLWNWLPARFSLHQPVLVFTTQEHGFRLQSLLSRIDEIEYSILIVKTTAGEVFGAFCAGLWAHRHNKTYFGFGESFLFTLVPKQTKYPWVGAQQHVDHDNRHQQVKREMFLFVSNEKLIIGGGNGDGLCIDASLCEGRTTHCETFNNDPLCSSSYFSIAVLEMITFDSLSS